MSTITLKDLKKFDACYEGRETFKAIKRLTGVARPTTDQLFITAIQNANHFENAHIRWGVSRFADTINVSTVKQISKSHFNDFQQEIILSLLRKRPTLIKYFDVNVFSEGTWTDLLYLNPTWIKKRNVKDRHYRARLVRCKSIFIKHVKYDDFTVEEWEGILNEQPQLIECCNKISKISSQGWYDILRNNPKYAKYCYESKLGMYIDDLRYYHPRIQFKKRASSK